MGRLIFAHPADTWKQRWEIVRRFTTAWCGVNLAPSPIADKRIYEAGRMIGHSLPASLCESIRFHSELEAAGWNYGLSIRPLPHLKAILLWSIEDDWYGVVHERDLSVDDPPVHDYSRGYGTTTEDQFGHFSVIGSTTTAEALLGMIAPARASGGKFDVQVEPTSAWLDEMRGSFDLSTLFCEVRVFESPGKLVFVRKDPFHPDSIISMSGLWAGSCDPIPECVTRWLSNGGAFSGRFA